jgi:hypothetical protein
MIRCMAVHELHTKHTDAVTVSVRSHRTSTEPPNHSVHLTLSETDAVMSMV